jgi:hypothetical protein
MFVDQEFDYYYGEQIKRYINQFAQVFAEMYVRGGKNDYKSETDYIRIPIMYGSPDKVVAAIKSENTQNKLLRLPAFSIKLENISIQLDRKSGTNVVHRKSVLPLGGDIKNDLHVVERLKALPYNFNFSVAALTSNSDQLFQIIEQVLMLFDQMLQFQTSDAYGDWTKIVDAELLSFDINNNRNTEDDNRILQCTFGFDVRGYLSPPANLRKNAIKSIRLRIDALDGHQNIQEVVRDVDRPEPPYTVIFDLDKSNIPPN